MRMADLAFTEYEALVREKSPIVVIPCGALEQHGPHLPLATDAMIPTMLAERFVPAFGGIVAPTFTYGVRSQPKSGGGNHFCGTTSLWGSTYALMVADIVEEFGRHGVKKIVMLDGHTENQPFLVEGVERALVNLRRDGITDVRVIRLAYYMAIDAKLQATLFPDGLLSWDLEHAAVMETSVMMALSPSHVRLDRIPDDPPADFPIYETFPIDPAPIPCHGVLSSAKSATAEKGRAVVDTLVAEFSDLIPRAFR
ncbi:creatininase [Acuticoccus mangrovi]|uniref:Creatininase n=1 Tax=Acuticoccus mangrovi TaxID=2796142 RepID=A0A934IQY1_9HYPH|nr:creatininase [Acuticoccus mangrovi]MBJ3776430.1 creatininase [Acuticoccus mangrovi]